MLTSISQTARKVMLLSRSKSLQRPDINGPRAQFEANLAAINRIRRKRGAPPLRLVVDNDAPADKDADGIDS